MGRALQAPHPRVGRCSLPGRNADAPSPAHAMGERVNPRAALENGSARQAAPQREAGGRDHAPRRGRGASPSQRPGGSHYLPPPHSPQTRPLPPSRPPLRRSPPRPAPLAPWPNAPAAAAGPRMHPSSAAAAEQQAPPALQGGGRGRGPGGAWRRREAPNQLDIRTGLRAAHTQGSCERPPASGAGRNVFTCGMGAEGGASAK
jgi:hypothetical protein